MKIAGKIIYALWAIVIAAVLCFYCFSCYMGFSVKELAVSSIESQGKDFANYDALISENDYIKLWHEKPDNASYDRVQMEELKITQEYTLSRPYIMAFKDNDNIFSLSKIGYIYNIKMYDANGNEVKSVAPENSKVVLDVSYEGLNYNVNSVVYDNDYDEYGVNTFSGIGLAVILLINSIARNVRYFDYCVKRRRKRHLIRFIQPYVFVTLIIAAIVLDALPYALMLGIAEEFILTLIFTLLNLKNRKI